MNKALVVIDFQNDFVNGTLGSPEAEALIQPLLNKIRENKDNDIFYTMDTHSSEYSQTAEGRAIPYHCQYETWGREIVPRAAYALGQTNAHRIFKNTFMYRHWEQEFEVEYDEIEICGVATDICVLNNALALRALMPEARIVVDAKCCAGTTVESHQKALDIMRNNCIEILN